VGLRHSCQPPVPRCEEARHSHFQESRIQSEGLSLSTPRIK
jgi:hypothetical protein